MDDIQTYLISNDLNNLCYSVADKVCGNKIKELIVVFVNQYAEHYLDNNSHSLILIHNRIHKLEHEINIYCTNKRPANKKERGVKELCNKRIVRITLCELFVILVQTKRFDNTYRNTKIKEYNETLSRYTDRHINSNMVLQFRNNYVHLNTYLNHLSEYVLVVLSEDVIYYIKQLVYQCVHEKQSNLICELLNLLHNKKELQHLLHVRPTLPQQIEFVPILESENTILNSSMKKFPHIWLLMYLCLSLCPNDKKSIVEKKLYLYTRSIITTSILTKRFNLILSAFTYAFCDIPQYHTNQLYTPIVAQCALKVDYIYQEKMEEYTKLSLDEEFQMKKEKEDKKKESQHMKEYNSVLFSLPSIQTKKDEEYKTELSDYKESSSSFDTKKSINPLTSCNIHLPKSKYKVVEKIIENHKIQSVEPHIPLIKTKTEVTKNMVNETKHESNIRYVTINSKGAGELIASKEKKYICKKIE